MLSAIKGQFVVNPWEIHVDGVPYLYWHCAPSCTLVVLKLCPTSEQFVSNVKEATSTGRPRVRVTVATNPHVNLAILCGWAQRGCDLQLQT